MSHQFDYNLLLTHAVYAPIIYAPIINRINLSENVLCSKWLNSNSRDLSKQFYQCLFLKEDWVFECCILLKTIAKLFYDEGRGLGAL